MIARCSDLTAFDEQAIGTKVTDEAEFMECLERAVAAHHFPTDGRGYILLDCFGAVSCGTASKERLQLGDYLVKDWRGEVGLFAQRSRALPVRSLAAIVLTREAYARDSQVTAEEVARITEADYVLVAVLASGHSGHIPLSSHRFVRNLAGGSEAYQPPGYTMERAIREAREIVEYERQYITVAD